MSNIFVVCLEPIDSRYTKQWYTHIPDLLMRKVFEKNLNVNIINVPGESVPEQTTSGAFLDFGHTNFYKGTQTANISKFFTDGKVKAGDKFLVTDIWNFAITAIRYMSDLMDIPVEIHAIAHAGAYDPSDILGFKMRKDWPHHQERAWFYACDAVYFGSEFHRKMFLKNLNIPKSDQNRAIFSGQPYEYMAQLCYDKYYNNEDRNNDLVFTHRLNSDKQPEIFRDLMQSLPDYGNLITQDQKLSKDEYYIGLSKCKIAFSCSLHENLGVGQMEATLCGAIPVVPSRASYKEIYLKDFKYPSEWTENFEQYQIHKQDLINFINNLMNKYNKLKRTKLKKQTEIIKNQFMNSNVMVDKLLTF